MLPIEVIIDSIERQKADESLVSLFALEAPQASPVAQDHHLLIAGWLLAKKGLATSSIEVVSRDQVLKRAPVNVPRPDVAKSLCPTEGLSDQIGFHFEISLLGLAKRFDLELRAAMRKPDGEIETVPLYRIKAHKFSHMRFDTCYQPLQLTAIGRSGTTLMMQILGQHPEILTTNFYPYELRQAAYWMHFLKTSSAPANFLDSAHPDRFEFDTHHIGHNPYNHPEYINQYRKPQQARRFYTDSTFNALAQLCIERVDEYYKMIAEDECKPKAKFFAEKFLPNQTQNICNELYKSPKEIILTRDFRDILCSARAFNRMRRSHAFGRDAVSDDLDWVDQLSVQGARELSEAWYERSSQALHVKYEDLIIKPAQQISRIFEYLDIDSSHGVIDEIIGSVFLTKFNDENHSTTLTPQASIGRWRRDMSSELQEHCKSRLGNALSIFGYDV